MKKYKVEFEQTLTGYIEVWADNEDDAIYRLKQQPPLNRQMVIETEDISYTKSEALNNLNKK